MRESRNIAAGGALAAALLLAGCTERGTGAAADANVKQTGFPGQLAAGSKSSGAIMQQSSAVTKSQMPSGTPGIPEGSGGTTSGAAMGGTTPGAAVAGDAPKGKMAGETAVSGPVAAPAKPSAAEEAAAKARKEKEELAAAMDGVARRWRAEAARNGWQTHAATPTDAVAGIASSGAQDKAGVAPPVRSEKAGSAEPSEDVKKPRDGVAR